MTGKELVLDPILPPPVIGLLLVALLFLCFRVHLAAAPTVGRWRGVVLLILRSVGIITVLLVLLQPSHREFVRPPVKKRVAVIALDSSISMSQRDLVNESRFDAAKNLLLDFDLVSGNGLPENPRVRLYEFSDDARPVQGPVLDLTPKGKTTQFNRSITTMLHTSLPGEAADALVLLTDGHDFELTSPVKTGAAARSQVVPIYAVVLGKEGEVRDVSAHMTSFQPYCYMKQKARLAAALRLIGCEYEDIAVQLLREGQVVQTKRLNAGESQELPVEFEVIEPAIGQYEYEIRVQPLEGETSAANNSTITYLNVIDQQIRVLLLEGDPYWDTTFLQRSLMRNEKFGVNSLISYGNGMLRAIRKNPESSELRAPETLDQFASYDAVILGRNVDQVISRTQVDLLEQYVKSRAGTVIFSRGPAFSDPEMAADLQPVTWDHVLHDRVRLDPTAEGRNLSAFHGLRDDAGRHDALPDLLAGKSASEVQPLTSVLAMGAGLDGDTPSPAVVYRRCGRGQVVSLGVEGLWRWSLYPAVEGVNAPFDRFWDQLILWLMAGRDFIPSRQFSFRPDSANVLLGEKINFRLTMRQPDPALTSVPLNVYLGSTEVARVTMSGEPSDTGRLVGELVPERIGRYRAVATFPDGSTQESRFIVYAENLEQTEVAADVSYMRRLCESSGGRIIQPKELPALLEQLSETEVMDTPNTQLKPIWDRAWVFYVAGLFLGLDWFLRRRWGLC